MTIIIACLIIAMLCITVPACRPFGPATVAFAFTVLALFLLLGMRLGYIHGMQ